MHTNKLFNKYNTAIDNVNNLIDVKDSGNLNERVKKICVFLTSSRSGSSLMKAIMTKSDDIAYLSGEEEPYYVLSRNVFPWANSDSFNDPHNRQYLLDLIFGDLGINIEHVDVERTVHDWKKRILYQFPELKSFHYADVERTVRSIYNGNTDYDESTKKFIQSFIPSKAGYYDIFGHKHNIPYTEDFSLEEPPFVTPSKKRSFTEFDIDTKTLVFKTPQDCYRIGLFENLFPNAEIKYIHMSRGFAQTVNGLMDGWLLNRGFFAHNMDMIDTKLDIKGYTDVVDWGNWWKFDLPPNWKEYIDKPLHEVTLNQWLSAHSHIINYNDNALRIKFEDFLKDPQLIVDEITDYIGIKSFTVESLPLTMISSTPGLYRWHKRKNLMLELAKRQDVKNMMGALNYNMNELEWL